MPSPLQSILDPPILGDTPARSNIGLSNESRYSQTRSVGGGGGSCFNKNRKIVHFVNLHFCMQWINFIFDEFKVSYCVFQVWLTVLRDPYAVLFSGRRAATSLQKSRQKAPGIWGHQLGIKDCVELLVARRWPKLAKNLQMEYIRILANWLLI